MSAEIRKIYKKLDEMAEYQTLHGKQNTSPYREKLCLIDTAYRLGNITGAHHLQKHFRAKHINTHCLLQTLFKKSLNMIFHLEAP